MDKIIEKRPGDFNVFFLKPLYNKDINYNIVLFFQKKIFKTSTG